jgi:hypothetical protein
MTLAARIFQRALNEKLAFVPLGTAGAKLGQQAPGPGGAPMDPAMGGAPPAPPMDPAMAGGMPPPSMDPAMGGMPPMDPAMAGGMPPMDPSMGMPPDMGMPPMPEAPPEPPQGSGVTTEDAEVVDKITKRTMDIVRQTLEMVGKAKPVEGKPGEAAPGAGPGPVTGQPGFDPSMIPGPLKMAAALSGIASRLTAGNKPEIKAPIKGAGLGLGGVGAAVGSGFLSKLLAESKSEPAKPVSNSRADKPAVKTQLAVK